MLVKNLVYKLINYCENNNRKFTIRDRITKEPYLIRYVLCDFNLFRIYIHVFQKSDRPDPHDHPASFFTYVVNGAYKEKVYKRPKFWTENSRDISALGDTPAWNCQNITRSEGQVIYRAKEHLHVVVIPEKYENLKVTHKDCPITISIFGPRKSTWGFWPLKDNGYKFVFWKKYLEELQEKSNLKGK